MPRKSSTAATPATPRKTRTRKTTTSRRKSASKINTSTAKITVAEVKEAPKVEVVFTPKDLIILFGGIDAQASVIKAGKWAVIKPS